MQPTLPYAEPPPRRRWGVLILRTAWAALCWTAAFGAMLYVGLLLL